MIAALIVFAVFFGIGWVIAVVAFCILLAHGKITLPGTNARRIQHEEVKLQVIQIRREQELAQMTLDAQINARLDAAGQKAIPA